EGHGDLCPGGPSRGSHGTCRPDQRGSSASGQRACPKNTNPGPVCMTMPKTDRGTGRPPESAYRLPEDGPLPDLPLYERLIDDGMLAARYQRASHSRAQPEQARPETGEPQILAIAHPDPETQTITFILDAATANTVMFAIAAHADEREAHVREVELLGQRFPE